MTLRYAIFTVALVAAGTVGAQAGQVTLADSVADFSGIQGSAGWEYGYFVDPTTNFTTSGFTFADTAANYWGFGTQAYTTFALVGSTYSHPGLLGGGAPTSYSVVRQWTNSSYAGLVTLSGVIQKADTLAPASQTLSTTIYKNGTSIFNNLLAGDNSFGTANYLFTTSLAPGDILQYALTNTDPTTNNHDLTAFTGTVTGFVSDTPEPTTFVLGASLLSFSMLLGRRKTS